MELSTINQLIAALDLALTVIVAEPSAQREFVNMQRGRETPGR